jgi:hypothetical protein
MSSQNRRRTRAGVGSGSEKMYTSGRTRLTKRAWRTIERRATRSAAALGRARVRSLVYPPAFTLLAGSDSGMQSSALLCIAIPCSLSLALANNRKTSKMHDVFFHLLSVAFEFPHFYVRSCGSHL